VSNAEPNKQALGKSASTTAVLAIALFEKISSKANYEKYDSKSESCNSKLGRRWR
jgi:hypothetical protein